MFEARKTQWTSSRKFTKADKPYIKKERYPRKTSTTRRLRRLKRGINTRSLRNTWKVCKAFPESKV